MSKLLPNSLSLFLISLVTATGLAGAACFSVAQPQIRSISTSPDGRFKVIVKSSSSLTIPGQSSNPAGTAYLYDQAGHELAQTALATPEPTQIQWSIDQVTLGGVVWDLPLSHDPNILIFQAALRGDRATFQKLLPQADLQFKTSHQTTLLHAAVQGGNEAIVQDLLSRNLTISAEDNAGETPLLIAVQNNAIELVQLLLQQGADVNQATQAGTPLLTALRSGDVKVAQLLIEQGAAVNAQDPYGITALHLAAKLSHVGLLQALIARGALLNPQTPNGMSPLTYVMDSQAATLQKQRSVDILIAAGASLEVPVLQRALIQGDKAMTAYLIGKGADVNFPNPIDGYTPLLQVMKSDDLTVAEKRDLLDRLLARGADLNAKDLAGYTPLAEAILHYSSESLPLIELLLKRGAAVNMATADNLTPLMLVAQTPYADVPAAAKSELVDLLIQYGANVNAKNPQGKTAIDLAIDASVQQQLRAAAAI